MVFGVGAEPTSLSGEERPPLKVYEGVLAAVTEVVSLTFASILLTRISSPWCISEGLSRKQRTHIKSQIKRCGQLLKQRGRDKGVERET